MPFDPVMMSERLKNRNLDFLIPKTNITEVTFNRDEIIFKLIRSLKKDIPDLVSFLISAMGASGLDEYDMSCIQLIPTDQKTVLESIDNFQTLWKLNLEIKKYMDGEIQYIYEARDTVRTNYYSEISFIIETENSYIYFFTHHFYY
ncbi:hypothetical protein [Chryseobacterium sp. 2987]|uniref:hypothetical protein n=1 Tax=Chryseobacterium sp. 2987 TaxID=2817767 RepID=UPI002864F549|nr:hypothetical protein [Chryseobacterium sp. 2987]MDR6922659.1 hypothetical protein [Chryseobacterium sp. 2987]